MRYELPRLYILLWSFRIKKYEKHKYKSTKAATPFLSDLVSTYYLFRSIEEYNLSKKNLDIGAALLLISSDFRYYKSTFFCV